MAVVSQMDIDFFRLNFALQTLLARHFFSAISHFRRMQDVGWFITHIAGKIHRITNNFTTAHPFFQAIGICAFEQRVSARLKSELRGGRSILVARSRVLS